MRRGLVVSIVPLFLGGCLPAIPPAISLATTGLSGLALLTTGKSTPDHVLSATVDEDCSMLRVVFGENPCRAYDDANTKPLTEIVAYYPGDSDDWVDRDAIPKGTVSGTTILTAFSGATRDEDASDAASPETAILEARGAEDGGNAIPPAISAGLQPFNDMIVVGFAPLDTSHALKPIELKSIVSQEDGFALPLASNASWKLSPDAAPSGSEMPMLQDSVAEMTVLPMLRPDDRGKRRSSRAMPEDHFVMLGSFRDKSRAEYLKDTLPSTPEVDRAVPVIMSVRVAGSLWHRVAVGPFTGRDALLMASAMEPISGRKPWAAKILN